MMIQGAGENRVACKTDSCTSQWVESNLSRELLRALYYQASSSVFYENRISCGVSCFRFFHSLISRNMGLFDVKSFKI